MKRILFSITGTIAGVVALLGFKTHSPAVTGALPAAALPGGASSTPAAPSTPPRTPSSGPSSTPRTTPSSRPASTPPSTAAASRTLVGQAVQTQYGVVQVAATVQGGKITNVKFLQLTAYDDQSQQINSYAAPILLQQTLSAQSSQIDGVSGASYTSAGYAQSLQSALDQAGLH